MLETYSPSRTFPDVHFALFGFDAITEHKVRSKLVDGGGVDVGGYTQKCTHVIVDKLVYDDPICVAAQNDGKVLVTALWVDHSYDIGMLVDPTSIMYRPVKDLNGIPGAKNLIICLTGYQRQDRDDVMTMVSLMGAQFSKPLVANKVTHLICYKFEGEKYELAKKMKKIKLVNHRWLEDCLRDWVILPEENYNKSGHELEMMEAEAKDSEEEGEAATVKQSGGIISRSPYNPKVEHGSTQAVSNIPAAKVLSNTVSASTGQETRCNRTVGLSNVNVPEMVGCHDADALGGATSLKQAGSHDRTPVSGKLRNNLECASRHVEKSPQSDAKVSASTYSRKTPGGTALSMHSEDGLNYRHSFPKLGSADVLHSSLSKVGRKVNGNGSNCVVTPAKKDGLVFEESSGVSSLKRKIDDWTASSRAQQTSTDTKSHVFGSAPCDDKSQPRIEPASAIDHVPDNGNHPPSSKDGCYIGATANPSPASGLKNEPLMSKRGSLICDMTLMLDAAQDLHASAKVDQTPHDTTGKAVSKKPEIGDIETASKTCVVDGMVQSLCQQEDTEYPSYSEGPKKRKPNCIAELGQPEGGDTSLDGKSLKKKTVAKKTLGSRPKLSSTSNKKGSIYVNKMTSKDDVPISLNEDNGDEYKASHPSEIGRSSTVDVVKKTETTNETKSGSNVGDRKESMDDETEAPEDKDEREVEKTLAEAKQMSKKSPVSGDGDTVVSKGGTNRNESEMIICKSNSEEDVSLLKEDAVKGKTSKKKCISGKTQMKTAPAAEVSRKKKGNNRKEALNKSVDQEMEVNEEKGVTCTGGKSNRSTKLSKVETSGVAEDNKSDVDGDQCISKGTESFRKVNSRNTPVKIMEKAGRNNLNSAPEKQDLRRETKEPACFIVSGHRLQRKEFHQVIRRLKGKACRDSHQWSYQATHFIAPEPIRRTEKFFAAAASGRWILKTEYLTASSQAGRFLAEEPYEWHKNCLTEDGAINLEAPRKWRLLREKTGHGAFYGMRIIIYGECIAPSLDTLKRAVKAGDGSILATSPPYTRFLESGVDFAVVSPGMPRVDIWVQEFLKHEIPCVVADYLVDYVCKPGYSLERHVLYNTRTWAEKSFANLQTRAAEIVEDLASQDSDDVSCEVCGSRDRGEVMLICGDETGSLGCGIGSHIDCCDPPLEKIPEEDWFCSKCISRKGAKSSKKRRKGN